MRLSDTGRACHPKMRASTLRYWTLDDVVVGGTSDASRGVAAALVGGAVLPVVNGPTGRARAFSDANATALAEAVASAESRDLMEGDWTVHVLVRPTAAPTGTDYQLVYSGNQGDAPTDPQQYMMAAGVLADGRPTMFWEFDGGTNVQVTAASYDLPLYKATLITWRKSLSTGPGDLGGTAKIELLINGHVVQIALGTGTVGAASQVVANTSHGSLARWKIGHETNGAGVPISFYQGHIIGAYVSAGVLSDDEIWEDVRRLYQLPFFARTDLRFDLETQTAGVFEDMTNVQGADWVDKAEVNDEADQPCKTAHVSLFREIGDLTLSVLRTDSKLNLTDPLNPASYVPKILEGRRCELFGARVPLGIKANGEDWVSILQGNVDEIDEGGAETIALAIRDSGGLLVDTFIEETVRYGNIPPVAVEGEMQFILNDNDSNAANNSIPNTNNPGILVLVPRAGSYAPITLYTPTAPGWAITLYAQRREGVLPALRTLAGQLGWEVRYRFDENPDQKAWRLTFYDPDRLREDVDCVFLTDDVLEVPRYNRSLLGVRNVFRVLYRSSETVAPAISAGLLAKIAAQGFTIRSGWNSVDGEGNRVSAYVEIESPPSIALFGRRLFCEIGEASSSQIDHIEEAATMAFGGLLDLQETSLEKGVRLPMVFESDLNDIHKFGPNILSTGIQRLAVKSVTHTFDAQATTSFQLRGKPTVGFKRWLRLEARQGNARPGVVNPADANADVYEAGLLQVMRNLMDRTAAFRGGKYLQVRNPDFQQFTNGLRNPPDAWSMRAGVWNTDVTVEMGTQLSGGYAIRFLTALGSIVSDPIQIEGSRFIPYSFEARWLRTVATLNVNNATLSAAAGSTVTLTVPVATFTAASVGSYVEITAAAAAGNVGRWLITAFTSTTVVTLTQEAGGAFTNGVNNFSWTACCTVRMDVEFLDVNRALLVTRTVIPEAYNLPSFGPEGLDAASLVWFSGRADGLAPADTSLARFVRIVITSIGGPSTFQPILVDTVSAYKTGLDARTFVVSLPLATTFTISGWYPVEWPAIAYPATSGIVVGRWDWGNTTFKTLGSGVSSFGTAIAGDVALPAWSGFGFYAREDGTYFVTAVVAVATTSAAARFSDLRFVVNATYTNVGATIGINATGQVVLQASHALLRAIANLGNAQFAAPDVQGNIMILSGRIRLRRGDRLTVEFYRDQTGGPGVSDVYQKTTTTLAGEICLFTVKQELTE